MGECLSQSWPAGSMDPLWLKNVLIHWTGTPRPVTTPAAAKMADYEQHQNTLCRLWGVTCGAVFRDLTSGNSSPYSFQSISDKGDALKIKSSVWWIAYSLVEKNLVINFSLVNQESRGCGVRARERQQVLVKPCTYVVFYISNLDF